MKMYCIVSGEALRAMGGNRGKLAAQAGHAFLHAYWDAENRGLGDPHNAEDAKIRVRAKRYRASGAATKVTLVVGTGAELEALAEKYAPICGHSLVVDAGKTVFNGPTLTCLGLGPIAEEDIGEDLRVLPVLV